MPPLRRFRRTNRTTTPESVGRALGFRSGLEEATSAHLTALRIPFLYEKVILPYEVHETRKYTPDFVLLQNGIIVETKGQFVSGDRKKHLLIRAQYPTLDLRFVFSNPNTKIGKKSSTTYGMWCASKGFQYAKGTIPEAWLHESFNAASARVIRAFMKETE